MNDKHDKLITEALRLASETLMQVSRRTIVITEELPEGFVPLQRVDGRLVYAACMNQESQFFGWLMWRHPDGQWVSERKLENWEIMQAEDQAYYGIVQESNPGAKEAGL